MSPEAAVERPDESATERAGAAATADDGDGWTDAEPTAVPSQLSVVLSVSLGGAAAAFLVAGSPLAAVVALLAVALLGASLSTVSRRLCSVAGGVFVGGVLAAGATAAPPAPVVGSAVFAIAA